jgi:penicillin-binding protein 1A
VSNRERVMDAITAYQLTSMMQGVVDRGTASGTVNLPVPVAGKTGTTNDARDVWFVGFTSNIVAGCYIGYDQPRAGARRLGRRHVRPGLPEFMQAAVKKYGGGKFEVPPGGASIKIDRYSGARLPDSARGQLRGGRVFPRGRRADLWAMFSTVAGPWARTCRCSAAATGRGRPDSPAR